MAAEPSTVAAQATPGDDVTVIVLVRHAEKVDASRDPELSPEGRERAELLATTLRDVGIERIHSTPYRRTESTAAPVAELLRVEVEGYDPRALATFAETLRSAGGRHLVVGHSNTTPALVEALGGDPGELPIDEAEYDRLYFVTIAGDGSVSTVLVRFGAPYDPSMARGEMRTPGNQQAATPVTRWTEPFTSTEALVLSTSRIDALRHAGAPSGALVEMCMCAMCRPEAAAESVDVAIR